MNKICSTLTTFNIVDFIESNPITKISTSYNSRLLEKIKENFTEEEQKLYVASFYCYLNYSKNDFIIELDNIWKWLGFNKKSNLKVVLIKNMVENIDYKILRLKSQPQVYDTHGGHNKEKITLTINAFKKLCLKAGTKKADDIHNYFIKMEEIMHEVVQEECEELKQQLENTKQENKQLENKTIELESEIKTLKTANELDRHNILCQLYDKKRLVYVLKMETLTNGHFVIKIGETLDIKQRCQAISTDFGIKVIVMDLFPCDMNYEFEQYLHRQPILYRRKYNKLINNLKKSTEAYLIVNMTSYNKIKQFIQRNMSLYQSQNSENIKYAAINNAIEAFKDDKEKLQQIIEKITTPSILPVSNQQYSQIRNQTDSVMEETNNIIENTIIENTPHIQEPPKSKPNGYSPKVQIYDPSNLTKVVKVFDSITEATREISGSSYTHIKYAHRHRTIYKNYRWHLISCVEQNPSEAKSIGQTVNSNQRRTGLVARLNIEKTQVLQVFKLQKDAANECNTHTSLISTAIRYGSSICGSFWVLWDDLEQSLKDDFLKKSELPTKQSKPKGSIVQQINPQTGMVEREFPSITDATKEMKISTKSIKKSSIEDIPMCGWKWKIL